MNDKTLKGMKILARKDFWAACADSAFATLLTCAAIMAAVVIATLLDLGVPRPDVVAGIVVIAATIIAVAYAFCNLAVAVCEIGLEQLGLSEEELERVAATGGVR